MGGVAGFFTDPERWTGSGGIPARLLEHVTYSVVATLIAMALALPIALWVGHTGRGEQLLLNVANQGRAIPSFGLILAAFVVFGLGTTPVYVALVALAIPPIVANAVVGIRSVDPDVRDAAEGMGMTGAEVLRRVELPLAVPLVMAGLRTSAVQVVATATLAAFVGLGGLGRYIVDGVAAGIRNPGPRAQVIAGALLVALLSVLTELAFGLVERVAVPRGLRRPRGLAPGAAARAGGA